MSARGFSAKLHWQEGGEHTRRDYGTEDRDLFESDVKKWRAAHAKRQGQSVASTFADLGGAIKIKPLGKRKTPLLTRSKAEATYLGVTVEVGILTDGRADYSIPWEATIISAAPAGNWSHEEVAQEKRSWEEWDAAHRRVMRSNAFPPTSSGKPFKADSRWWAVGVEPHTGQRCCWLIQGNRAWAANWDGSLIDEADVRPVRAIRRLDGTEVAR